MKRSLNKMLFTAAIVILATRFHAQPDTWTQTVSNGFGSLNNIGLTEFAVFQSKVFVATQRAAASGAAEVWKSSSGNSGSFTKVTSYSPALLPSHGSVTGMASTAFGGGIMYVCFGNSQKGTVVYRSSDGTSFSKMSKNGFGDVNNFLSSPNPVVFKGTAADTFLYVGTRDTIGAAEVWRVKYSNTDSTLWTKVVDFATGLGLPASNSGVKTITWFWVFNNKIYFGTDGPGGVGAQLYRSDNGITWTAITTNGFGNPANKNIASMADYKNNLYATTFNSVTGGQLWRSSNGSSFTQVTSNAFGQGNAIDELHRIVVANGWLWTDGIWTAGTVTPTIVWRSSDGINWTQSAPAGFGSSGNNGGFPPLFEFGSFAYCGIRNTSTGAQLWRTNVGIPVAGFIASDTLVCEGATITFTDTSSTAISYTWEVNGAPFDTSANTSYTFSSAGTYTVSLIVTNNSISDTMNVNIQVNMCTGSALQEFPNRMTLFPNPFSIQTVLQMDAEIKNGTLFISNLLGQTIRQINFSGQKIILQRDNLPTGIYCFRLEEDGRIIAEKGVVIIDR